MIRKRLHEIRIRFGLNAGEMAKKLGMTAAEYGDLEINGRHFTGDDLNKYLMAFPDLTAEDFFTNKQIDLGELEFLFQREFNKLAQHYYSQDSQLERSVLIATALKRELQMNEEQFLQVLPYLKHLKEVPLDVLRGLIACRDDNVVNAIRGLLPKLQT
jgi:transcriptional regulator with XRE-family HTH domain